jgi:hypothetical protein
VKFETYLLLAFILFCVWRTHLSVRRGQTARERFFAMRTSIFSWFVVLLLVAAFLFLPNRARVLLLLPVVLGGISVARFFRDPRARLRRANQDRVDIERMTRVD